MILTADKGRGQRRLTAEAIEAICAHYGWRGTGSSCYEDRGQVYIGSNYAGRVDGDELVLDRGMGGTRGAKRLAVTGA